MDPQSFEKKVGEILDLKPEEQPYSQATRALEGVAKAVQAQLGAEATRVTVEPGYQVKTGQQFKVVVAIPSRNFQDVLFRAYVPPTGFPVSLDLYGEEPVRCQDEAALQDQLLQFLARAEVKSRLGMLKQMASSGSS